MGAPLDAMVIKLGAPPALGGFVMAVLVLTPESIAAIRAALANSLQRSVNILLGSVLASIGLTIPLVIAVALSTGRVLVLGVDAADTVLLVLSLITSHAYLLPAADEFAARLRPPAALRRVPHADVRSLKTATQSRISSGKGARFGLIDYHPDTEREFACDRESHIGKLDKGHDPAKEKGRTVVSMKGDWKTIYP